MIIGKEALVNIERMFEQQYKVYPDSADLGIELTDSELDALRTDVKTLKGIYSGVNIYPTPDINGVKEIIIPIEELMFEGNETDVYRCMKIEVVVSRQFKTIAFIEIHSDTRESQDIPFFNKAEA